MRKYLSTLHKKSDHHKKRFSLLVSSGVTLLIFAVWVSVRFPSQQVVATDTNINNTVALSPIESLRASVSGSWQALSGQLDKAKEGLEAVELENTYGN